MALMVTFIGIKDVQMKVLEYFLVIICFLLFQKQGVTKHSRTNFSRYNRHPDRQFLPRDPGLESAYLIKYNISHSVQAELGFLFFTFNNNEGIITILLTDLLRFLCSMIRIFEIATNHIETILN